MPISGGVSSGGGGAGTQYTDSVATPSNPIGNAIMFDNSGTLVDVGVDHPFPIAGSFSPPANQRVSSTSGDYVAGSIADLASLLTAFNTNTADLLADGDVIATINSAIAALATQTTLAAVLTALGPLATQTTLAAAKVDLDNLVTLLTNPVNAAYEYNSGGPGGGNTDRVRNVQGKGIATATISTATVGQAVVVLNASAPATLAVGMQVELLGGTQENAYVLSISGANVTLSSNILNASHTSMAWDIFAANGPLAVAFSSIGVGLRAMALYSASSPANTPYVEALADALGNLKVVNPGTDSSGNQQIRGVAVDFAPNAITTSAAAGGATAVAGADFFTQVDVSLYRWFSCQFTGTWSATFTFQMADENANWFSTNVQTINISSTSTSTAQSNNIYHGPIFARYLRIRCTAFTSNTSLGGVITFWTTPPAFGTIAAAQTGTWTIQPGNTQNTTPWLTAGPTTNGVQAAGGSLTVIKASAGYLWSATVTTLGTAQLDIYDNASAASGNKLLSIPASAPVGSVYGLTGGGRASAGITSSGVASCPAVTFQFS